MMRYITGYVTICVLLIFFATTGAFANEAGNLSTDDIINNAERMIEEKQYYSAFKLLNDSPNGTENLEIALKKVETALNYHVSSIKHETFGFKDLDPDEDLMDLRGKEGIYSTFRFPIGQVLGDLLLKYPEEWRIHKALGDYYYEVFQRFRGKWIKSDEELLLLADNHYRIAMEHEIYDLKSLYFLGLIQLFQKNYQEAVPLLKRAVEIGTSVHPLYATANYNLAYACLHQQRFDEGLESALTSYDLYQQNQDKADAARMVGIIYRQLGEGAKAIQYYLVADQLVPNNYYSLLPLLQLYLEDAELTKADEIAERLMGLGPSAPGLLNDIMTSYGRNGYSLEFIDFCQRMGAEYAEDQEVMGNIHFHIGFCYYVLGDYEKCRNHLVTAKTHYNRCYPASHEVFSVISDYLSHIESL